MSVPVELNSGYVEALGRNMAILKFTPEVPATRPDLNHTILILDCSGSMWGSLESVKSDARQFVAELNEQDFVSVVVFSGHGRAQLVAGPTRCDQTGKRLLNQAIRDRIQVMDTTVFSEPLELVLKQLRQSNGTDMANQAVLFTDGCAVPTYWDFRTEQNKALRAAEELYAFGAAVSVIGYGYYYDYEFVTELMKAGGNSGIFRHMSFVEDFGDVIRDIRDTFVRVDLSDIKLRIFPSDGAITGVYRALPELAQVSANPVVNTRGLFEGTLTLYLDLTHNFDTATVTVTVNGKRKFYMPDAFPLTPEQKAECVRVTAAYLVLTGETAEAVELLQQTGDEGVAESVAEAYTEHDRRETADRIRRAFRDKKFIGAGLKPSGPSHCVLNVLRALMEDDSVVISIPAGGYSRGGVLTRDPRVVESPLGRTLKVVNYTGNQERFNFSLTTEKNVHVRPVNGDGATIDDSAEPVAANVHRSYNLVRDGELVMKEIYASMAEATFRQLQDAGVIGTEQSYSPGRSYKISFTEMKMVSSAWARPGSLRLIDLLKEEAELKAEQTALNAHIKELGKPEPPEFEGNIYRESAEAVDIPREYYTAQTVELKLVKYKASYVNNTAELSLDQAMARVKEVRRRLRTVRFLARCITFACHATGWNSVAWGPEAPVSSRSSKVQRLATLSGQQVKLMTGSTEVAYS